jgi:hypothetical protein
LEPFRLLRAALAKIVRNAEKYPATVFESSAPKYSDS